MLEEIVVVLVLEVEGGDVLEALESDYFVGEAGGVEVGAEVRDVVLVIDGDERLER